MLSIGKAKKDDDWIVRIGAPCSRPSLVRVVLMEVVCFHEGRPRKVRGLDGWSKRVPVV